MRVFKVVDWPVVSDGVVGKEELEQRVTEYLNELEEVKFIQQSVLHGKHSNNGTLFITIIGEK